MKYFVILGMSSLILVSAACDRVAKTSTTAPNTPNETALEPNPSNVERAAEQDGVSQLRRRQLNADIRAREQRTNLDRGSGERQEADLESEVRSKLEANIPAGQLAVDANSEGIVTISGNVPTYEQLGKIEPLAQQINGVRETIVRVTVSSSTPNREEQK